MLRESDTRLDQFEGVIGEGLGSCESGRQWLSVSCDMMWNERMMPLTRISPLGLIGYAAWGIV